MLTQQAGTQIEAHAIEHAVERLVRHYAHRHDPEVVRQTVHLAAERYGGAEVHTFVPVLVEREARRVLDARTG